MTHNLIHDLIDYLGLEFPVYVEFRTIARKGYNAYYMPKYSKKEKVNGHIIKINMKDSDRDIDTLVAHEMIHAWQEENKYKDTHGKSFRKMAAKVSKAFDIKDIYIKDVDQ